MNREYVHSLIREPEYISTLDIITSSGFITMILLIISPVLISILVYFLLRKLSRSKIITQPSEQPENVIPVSKEYSTIELEKEIIEDRAEIKKRVDELKRKEILLKNKKDRV